MRRREFLASSAAGVAALGLPSLAPGAPTAESAPLPPPRSPLAMWALTGKLLSDDVCRQLDAFRAVGWGAVLYPRWGLELEYLSEAWLERIAFIVEQAAAREMELWLYDEFCWPSGHARGLVTKGRDDLIAEVLEVEANGKSRVTRLPGSANLLLRGAARPGRNEIAVDVTSTLGHLFGPADAPPVGLLAVEVRA